MERLILNSNQLKGEGYKIADDEVSSKMELFYQKFGQLKDIIVREVDDGYEILDGSKLFNVIRKRTSEIKCMNLGKISDYDADIVRLCLNELVYDTDNILFSEVISRLVKNQQDAIRLSGKLRINAEDIIRYTKLNEVDWTKELKIAEEQARQHPTLF